MSSFLCAFLFCSLLLPLVSPVFRRRRHCEEAHAAFRQAALLVADLLRSSPPALHKDLADADALLRAMEPAP